MYAKFFAVAALVSAVVALPGGPTGDQQICSTGTTACCNNVQTVNDQSIQHIHNHGGGLLDLLDLVAGVGDVNALIGLDCSPVTALGISGNSCNSQATCCSGNNFNGLVAVGCTPVNVNL